MTKDSDEFVRRMALIVATLERLPAVRAKDTNEDHQASTMAHGFLDIEESLKKLSDEYLPTLEKGDATDEQLDELLFDIGEELRHVLYHINDMAFYSYLR
jgi:hypothetical protein